MARSVAALSVSVSARTSKFNKGMRRASLSLRRFTSRVGSATIGALKFGGALVGLGGAAAFGALLFNSFKTIDALAKMSQKLGIATEDMLGLQHAAALTGVGTQSLEMGLQRFTRRLAESADRVTPLSQALQEVGLSAKELNKVGIVEAFKRLADAMGGMSKQSDKILLAFRALDSEGVNLIRTLDLGREGIDRAIDEMAALRPVTSAAAKSIELANDAMLRTKTALQALADAAAIAASPALVKLSSTITGFAIALRDTDSIVRKNVVSTLKWAAGLGAAAVAISVVSKLISIVVSAQRALAKSLAVVQSLSGPKGWALLAGSVVAATAAMVAIDRNFDNFNRTAATAQRVGAEFAETYTTGMDGAKTITVSFENAIKDLNATMTTAFQDPIKQAQKFIERLGEMRASFGKLPEEIILGKIQTLVRQGVIPEKFLTFGEVLVDALGKARIEAEKLADATKTISDSIHRAGDVGRGSAISIDLKRTFIGGLNASRKQKQIVSDPENATLMRQLIAVEREQRIARTS